MSLFVYVFACVSECFYDGPNLMTVFVLNGNIIANKVISISLNLQTFQLGTPLTKDQDTYWPVSYNVRSILFFLEKIGKMYTPYNLVELDLERFSEQRLQIAQPLAKDQKKKKIIDITVFDCLFLI